MTNRLFLLIHTMTITECDYVVQAQFFHTFFDDIAHVNNARLVGRRISLRIQPSLRNGRNKAKLHQLQAPSLKTLMKKNPHRIRHHIRTVQMYDFVFIAIKPIMFSTVDSI